MTILVTGGAGFIGSNFVLNWFKHSDEPVVNLDKLTYAGNLQNLKTLASHPGHHFVVGDVNDVVQVRDLLHQHHVRAIVHFAAESHVDRSIDAPDAFMQTNIMGTFNLLHTSRSYWANLAPKEKLDFRFLHVSTDEVYGSLDAKAPSFTEEHRYEPNSPYSASKAASDHLVRAYHHTYGLPTLTTNCSNNYGPYQFPEKLIPLCIQRAIQHLPIPIYGHGHNIRDWLYVEDHCEALRVVLERGSCGEVYNIGGCNEKTNLEVVDMIIEILDEAHPRPDGLSYKQQITFVKDRPGHDARYAMNASKIEQKLGWKPQETFESGIRKTVHWYLEHQHWMHALHQACEVSHA